MRHVAALGGIAMLLAGCEPAWQEEVDVGDWVEIARTGDTVLLLPAGAPEARTIRVRQEIAPGVIPGQLSALTVEEKDCEGLRYRTRSAVFYSGRNLSGGETRPPITRAWIYPQQGAGNQALLDAICQLD